MRRRRKEGSCLSVSTGIVCDSYHIPTYTHTHTHTLHIKTLLFLHSLLLLFGSPAVVPLRPLPRAVHRHVDYVELPLRRRLHEPINKLPLCLTLPPDESPSLERPHGFGVGAVQPLRERQTERPNDRTTDKQKDRKTERYTVRTEKEVFDTACQFGSPR